MYSLIVIYKIYNISNILVNRIILEIRLSILRNIDGFIFEKGNTHFTIHFGIKSKIAQKCILLHNSKTVLF